MVETKSLFQRENDHLLFDDINLEKEIAKVYGTPLYIFSESQLNNNISRIQQAFQKCYSNSIIAYSVKNNMIKGILKVIANELEHFEITSLGEFRIVEQVIKEHKKPLTIIQTNLYKSDQLIEKLLYFPELMERKFSIAPCESILAIDSYQDFQRVEQIAQKTNKKPKVIVRVNPGIKMALEETIFASAIPSSKCGLIIKDTQPIIEASDDPTISSWLSKRKAPPKKDFAEKVLHEINDSPHLNLVGLHGHLGSQVTNLDYFQHFFHVIAIFYREMQEKLGKQLSILDLGGGYPVTYSSSASPPSIEQIAETLSSELQKTSIYPQLFIESGRFITASAAILLSKVLITKENPMGGKIAIMDFSVYSDLLDVLVAQWTFESQLVTNLPQQNTKKTQKANDWQLVGITNDTMDRLNPRKITCQACGEPINPSKERSFPRDLKPGDLIAIKNTGAYTTCFNSNYCGKPKPAIILLYKQKPRITPLRLCY
ncbi:MAG: hypothetical protein GF308_19785 [Candidatus Heimdallarchaeota archaeon]|nr:hypothetical protein [Candidatus Heimdallarchaeota archaeon]